MNAKSLQHNVNQGNLRTKGNSHIWMDTGNSTLQGIMFVYTVMEYKSQRSKQTRLPVKNIENPAPRSDNNSCLESVWMRKCRIRETPNALTNAESSTNIFVSSGVKIGADSIFFVKIFSLPRGFLATKKNKNEGAEGIRHSRTCLSQKRPKN